MDLSTVLLFLLYAAALIFVVYFMMSQNTSTVYIQRDAPVVYPEAVYSDSSWWPFPITSYNYWPYWSSWAVGGSDGGYWHHGGHRGGYPRPRFGGGPHGQLGGRYGPIGTPASRPGGGGFGGHGGGRGGGGGRR